MLSYAVVTKCAKVWKWNETFFIFLKKAICTLDHFPITLLIVASSHGTSALRQAFPRWLTWSASHIPHPPPCADDNSGALDLRFSYLQVTVLSFFPPYIHFPHTFSLSSIASSSQYDILNVAEYLFKRFQRLFSLQFPLEASMYLYDRSGLGVTGRGLWAPGWVFV